MFAFPARPLPQSLEALTELALNLRWTWNHALDELWKAIDLELWERTGNPWIILQNVSQRRLDELCVDERFNTTLVSTLSDLRSYMRDEGWWHTREAPDGIRPVIAYFSMEFGLSEAFPLYAGGLGVLAGDFLKTASDLGIPLIGIGLLFREGYFRQGIDADGWQREAYPYNDPTSLPIQPVVEADGAWLKVRLELPGRSLFLRVWQAIVGRTKLYLLDSNDLLNRVADRAITSKLYAGGVEMRLLQEMCLGVGGYATLDALNLHPDVCHLNEGHAALVVLERARRFMMQAGCTFRDAWWATRAGNVFTTHTPVAAGFDRFPPALALAYLGQYAHDFDIAPQALLALGRIDRSDPAEPFNLACLAMRGAAQTNAVSRLHADVTRAMFATLYPRWPTVETPISYVTNAVHVPTWDSAWSDALWTDACGKARWLGATYDHANAILATSDEALWALAGEQRRDLVRFARERLAWQLGQRGEPQEKVADASRVLDPNILTIGIARRFAGYKRPNLLLTDPARLERLLTNEPHPVQLIVAGKAHPDDSEGKTLIHAWFNFSHIPQLRNRVVFLEDYDIAIAQQLVQGVDVWVNTPRRPWEACGTSGMKVLVNGGLNVSSLDGWWAEAYRPDLGWAIDSSSDGTDDEDASHLYELLEREIVPAFYGRDELGIPREWVKRMRASMAELAPRFSSNRMLREYLESYYLPAASVFRNRSRNRGEVARELAAWEANLESRWHELHFGSLSSCREGDEWRFCLPVYFGEVPSEWLRVELFADNVDHGASECWSMVRGEPIAGSMHGYIFRASVKTSRPAEHYTPRVRASREGVFAPSEIAAIAWYR
ncbi:DUF3417 domain-containing protein (plasmid) [Burkholderia sp. JP2-270]|uniref:alpha-glucan family phosphorylase n=1 Tax=Burkholderia sp. JP2-270 TaxID=2217913 RepID=UPI000DA2ED43|nr:alpha-glucan family phosphorylase [Burkholderia sp. JP2-270]AWV05528.1 DUF3417 domain-containing protein [Burkholderia sp. JP2-270]